jgi:DHA1 family chloramphenicol resistance protein-like MFS transporter
VGERDEGIPAERDGDETTGKPALRAELAQLARQPLILVNAATLGTLTFLALVVTGSAGLGEWWISVAPVLFGAGSFIGVTVAGRLPDRRPGPVIAVAGPLLLIGWPALAMPADEPVALFVLVFVRGCPSRWAAH